MHELTADNTTEYLRATGRVAADDRVMVRELSGGVSNVVLRVDVAGRAPFVVKQCRERLRVAVEWLARLDRIWVEHATLGVLGDVLPAGTVPEVLFDDRAEYLFAMSCAPDDATTWKAMLMEGRADAEIAAKLGTLLGTIHAEAPRHPALHTTLADTSLFDELRIDPYYRTTARAHPALADRFDALIASMALPEDQRTLVLGDFSPKNILVHGGGLILLDFECAHAGDPAFDLGFFLSHLALKRIHKGLNDPNDAPRYRALLDAFWSAYCERVGPRDELTKRAVEHTAACLLARVDGKSPVEYLDDKGRDVARTSALTLFASRPETWEGTRAILDAAFAASSHH
jgi:5-methylthioribose kinase